MKEFGQNKPYVFRRLTNSPANTLSSMLIPSSSVSTTKSTNSRPLSSISFGKLPSEASGDLLNAKIDVDWLVPGPEQFVFELAFLTLNEFMPLVRCILAQIP